MRTIIGITGATGVAFTMDFLKRLPGEKIVIPTRWGKELLRQEASLELKDLEGMVTALYRDDDLAAPISSGSTPFDALVILPCSAGTLNKIACGLCDTLLTRTAMVALKEKRRLVLCLRETPLSAQTLRNAAQLCQDGAFIMPPCPPFYQNPLTLEDVLKGFSTRLLQVLGHPTEGLWKPGELDGME
jgi:4-hydroxy-3-polyprenylbenzoate decarboxylase